MIEVSDKILFTLSLLYLSLFISYKRSLLPLFLSYLCIDPSYFLLSVTIII